MKKTKWNYAVVRTIFGDFWIGKTKLPVETRRIFSKFEDAQNSAIDLFSSDNSYVGCAETDENYNADKEYELQELQDINESDVEIIKKETERFIVKG